MCVFIARPAYATSTTPTPTPSPTTTVSTVADPLGVKILTEEAAVESLGQQVQAFQESVAADQLLTNQAYVTWQTAVTAQNVAQKAVSAAATQAYEDQQGLGPYSQYSSTIRGLGLIAPGLVSPPSDGEAAAVNLAQARLATANAFSSYSQALTAEQNLQGQADDEQASFTKQTDALAKLKAKDQLAIAQATAAQQAGDSTIGAGIGAGTEVNGTAANPKALAAVHFALEQLGKPYVFGAEGPNSFDCSGLTWDAYRSVGITIPRIARYQQHALTPISVDELLPGDLIFFSGTNGTSWTSVSHVGMYYGKAADGTSLMIEAPMTGEDVKIAPVWWSHFFSAARVVPAVAAPPQANPTPTPTPSPTPTPTPKPSKSPSPSPTPKPTHSPSPTPSPSKPPTPPPTTPPPTTPPPAPTTPPATSPSATPGADPSPSAGTQSSGTP
jgi:peptidoglycan DL-endopeptidase CwlO